MGGLHYKKMVRTAGHDGRTGSRWIAERGISKLDPGSRVVAAGYSSRSSTGRSHTGNAGAKQARGGERATLEAWETPVTWYTATGLCVQELGEAGQSVASTWGDSGDCA